MHERSGVRVTMVQLPALNTPQFDVVRTRLPRNPQPVAPIYQPEVAARAIVAAASHPARREWWVGGSTALTLMGNALLPGLGDRYLARTAYEAQQTDEPEEQSDGNRQRRAHEEEVVARPVIARRTVDLVVREI